MAMTFDSRTISVRINRPLREVYEFVSAPENFPKWASGLGQSVERVNDGWIVETPQGSMKIRFTEPNSFGVLDHYVTAEPGKELYNPMRVIANGEGSEVSFTVFRQPEWSDERFVRDTEWVARDLEALKSLLEA